MKSLVFACLSFSLLISLACQTTAPTAPAPDDASPAVPRVVDLTYSFDASTIYWPTDTKGFQHEQVLYGRTEAGYWYSTYNYSANEHGGTHMDAPIHFGEGKLTVDEIPVDRLVAPAVKISIADKAAQDRDYLLTAADIEQWEARSGRIPENSIVLIETGWGQYWGDRLMYLGSDKPGDASDLHFPGIGRDAAELLVARHASLVGIDTASLDYGPSKDFITHQVLNGANIAGLENVANMDQLPDKGFLIAALPMKIAKGSGGPCRIVALFNR